MNFETTNLITLMGWRMTYELVGAFFILTGLFILIVVKDPKRGCFSYGFTPVQSSLTDLYSMYKKVLAVPCAFWSLTGMFFRNYAYYTALQYSTRLFFMYGLEYKTMTSYWLTFASVVGGIFSNIFIGGYLCDMYD